MSTRVKKTETEVVILDGAVPHSRDGLKLVWSDGFGHVFNYVWVVLVISQHETIVKSCALASRQLQVFSLCRP